MPESFKKDFPFEGVTTGAWWSRKAEVRKRIVGPRKLWNVMRHGDPGVRRQRGMRATERLATLFTPRNKSKGLTTGAPDQ
jgi:hypothetical protein